VLISSLDCHEVVRLLALGQVIVELLQSKWFPDNGALLLFHLGAGKVLGHMGVLGKDVATRKKYFIGICGHCFVAHIK